MKRQHILLVSPSFNIGGIERTVSEFANYFDAKGYQITFLSLLQGKRHFILKQGIQVVEPTFKRSNSVWVNALYRLRLILFIRSTVKENLPDVVLSMSDTFNYLVIASLLRLPCKVFVGDVTKPDRKMALLTRLGKRIFYPKAAGFIAQTNSAASYYRQFFKNRLNLVVINGAVKHVEKFEVAKKRIILCAGRLSYEKGQDRLIEAFSLLENREGWKIVLTADGPFKVALQKLVADKELTKEVIFAGKVDDIDRLYAEASIFVLPSRMEGFPNALTEAMAAGLPCICFDSFPAHEIVDNEVDGFIVKDGDVRALALKMSQLMDDEVLRKEIGERAQRISDRLSIENIGNQMLTFILPGN